MLRPVRLTRRTADLTAEALADLPLPCRRCVFWELDPVARHRAEDGGDPGREKESWVSTTVLEWGSAGKVCRVDGQLAGYALCAPASLLPRAAAFPTSPVSQDAVLLATLRVVPEFEGSGLGKVLVHAVAKQALRRPGVRAIEAFGDAQWQRPACLVPAGYLEKLGFQPVRAHSRYPRLRLDLRTVLTWRAEVEVAWERLREAVSADTAPRPVGTATSSAGHVSRLGATTGRRDRPAARPSAWPRRSA